MKKTLIIARHAHTHDPAPGVADHERQLTAQGLKCAQASARWLQHEGIIPDRIIASSAVRTEETAAIYAGVLLNDPEKFDSDDILYKVTEVEVIEFIHENLTSETTVMLIGHNPTASQLVTKLGASNISYLPPASLVLFPFDLDSWTDLSFHSGHLLARHFPEED